MDLYILVAAVATGTALHAIMEPGNVIYKLSRLEKAIKTGKIEDPPMKGIDTRTKAYSLTVISTLVLSGVSYFVINLINPSEDTALNYSVAVMLVGALIMGVRIDKYHVLIEKVTQAQKKK